MAARQPRVVGLVEVRPEVNHLALHLQLSYPWPHQVVGGVSGNSCLVSPAGDPVEVSQPDAGARGQLVQRTLELVSLVGQTAAVHAHEGHWWDACDEGELDAHDFPVDVRLGAPCTACCPSGVYQEANAVSSIVRY